jgi:hypothetical protein
VYLWKERDYTKDGRTDELKKGRTTVGWKGVNKGEGGDGGRQKEREKEG